MALAWLARYRWYLPYSAPAALKPDARKQSYRIGTIPALNSVSAALIMSVTAASPETLLASELSAPPTSA